MIKTLIISLAIISNLFWLIFVFIYPFLYVKKTGRVLKGILLSWGLNFLYAILISFFIPSIIFGILPDYKQVIYDSFPDSIGIGPTLFLGWFPALIVCGIAYGIHRSINMGQKSKTDDNPVHPV